MFRECAVLVLQNHEGDVLVVQDPNLKRHTVGVQLLMDDDRVSNILDLNITLNRYANGLTGFNIPSLDFIGSYDERDIPADIKLEEELMIMVPVFEIIIDRHHAWRYTAQSRLISYWVPIEEIENTSNEWLTVTQFDRNILRLVAKKTRPLLPLDYLDGKREERGVSDITPRNKLKELSLQRRTQLEHVIGIIEYELWQQAYVLPISFKISFPFHPDTMKLVRKHYMDAGYEVDIKDDPYPSWTIGLS